ncbi:MAG: GTPase Era, partial [Planctomycetes bacterium]|nr:GTPase Era [Planctomycetota bacterium]
MKRFVGRHDVSGVQQQSRGASGPESFRCGYVALVGRPNVGKSTLMNRILGQKLSIVTAKPQTTRQRIAGIKTTAEGQVIYVDTPGIHRAARSALNRYMNRIARAALHDVDLVLFLVEGDHWTSQDEDVARTLSAIGVPVFLVVNKIDRVPDKARLLDLLSRKAQPERFAEVFMISARSGDGVPDLERRVLKDLPFSRAFYDEDQFTDRSERFLAGELVREQLMMRLHQELPYALAVEIEQFSRDKGLLRIGAIVWVE